jgi:hypothetical protein
MPASCRRHPNILMMNSYIKLFTQDRLEDTLHNKQVRANIINLACSRGMIIKKLVSRLKTPADKALHIGMSSLRSFGPACRSTRVFSAPPVKNAPVKKEQIQMGYDNRELLKAGWNLQSSYTGPLRRGFFYFPGFDPARRSAPRSPLYCSTAPLPNPSALNGTGALARKCCRRAGSGSYRLPERAVP